VFTAADPTTSTLSHFAANTETLGDVLKMQTVGLVHLSEFKKCCFEVAKERDREAAEKLQLIRRSGGRAGGGPTSSSQEGSEAPTGNSGKRTKKRKKVVKGK